MSRDTDLAWCAGFFDGEGHVSYHRSYPSKHGTVSAQLYANVPQAATNIEVLEFFQSIVQMGKIKGPYEMQNGKMQYKLQFGVLEVEPLLALLKPYLRAEKTADFQRALVGYWTHDSSASEEDYARSLRRAKKKGLPEVV